MFLDAPGPLILMRLVVGFIGAVIFPVALYLLNYRFPPLVTYLGMAQQKMGWLLLICFLAYLVLALATLWFVIFG